MLLADGVTYERAAAEAWLAACPAALPAPLPATGQPLPHRRVVPNRAMGALLDAIE